MEGGSMSILARISELLAMSPRSLGNFASTAPHRYKTYTIPKRNGKGERLIAHPSKELKGVQRLGALILSDIYTSPSCVTAYMDGLSIKDNAGPHSKNPYILKLDIIDFFNSITPELFLHSLTLIEYNIDGRIEKEFLSSVFFWRKTKNSDLALSVGAPSSPIISNIVMLNFDFAVLEYCKKKGITYTRYADDLTFSTNRKNILFDVPSDMNEILANLYNSKLKINADKTVFSSKKHNRHVTGITITNEGQLSVGRARKREVTSLIHKFGLNLLSEEESARLSGLLSFTNFIEPNFEERMTKKYGCELIEKIKRLNVHTE